MFNLDFETVQTIILLVFLLIMAKAFFGPFFSGLFGRPKTLKPADSIDWINVLYKHNKLASKLGRREIRGRLLWTGDGSIVPKAERYTGIIPDSTVTSIFWKPRWYMRSRWVLVPTQLIYDLNAKNIRINCKSFRPLDDTFWAPVFCYEDRDRIEYYMDQISDHILWLTNYMAIILSSKNRLDSVATASQTREVPAGYIRTRDGYSPNEVAYNNNNREADGEEPI